MQEAPRTLGKLREALSVDKKIKYREIEIELKEDGEIHVNPKGSVQLLGWFNKDSKDEAELKEVMHIVGGTSIFNYITSYQDIALLLGMEYPELKVQEKEVEVVKESKETFKYEGMVEAYEKILLGRDLTIGK